jgi:hypothetical protein
MNIYTSQIPRAMPNSTSHQIPSPCLSFPHPPSPLPSVSLLIRIPRRKPPTDPRNPPPSYKRTWHLQIQLLTLPIPINNLILPPLERIPRSQLDHPTRSLPPRNRRNFPRTLHTFRAFCDGFEVGGGFAGTEGRVCLSGGRSERCSTTTGGEK